MKALIPKGVGLISRFSARLGSAIAWYLWFHPHGRPNARLPENAEGFSFGVAGHEVSGFALGSGDPVLLLHGWGGASSDMAPIATAFADAGFLAVVPDLPGHGADRGSHTDVFRMAAAVDAVASRFGSPWAVVAHSFGAVVTFGSFPHGGPDRVVLIAPAIRGRRFLDEFAQMVNLSDKAFERFEARFHSFAGPHLMKVMAGNGDVPGADMLVLHDPADDRTPYDDAAAYAASRPATKLVEVPGTGHKGILLDSRTLQEAVAFIGAGVAPRS
jgi:pimeloyl-ACP methyl ester carboxylesterase